MIRGSEMESEIVQRRLGCSYVYVCNGMDGRTSSMPNILPSVCSWIRFRDFDPEYWHINLVLLPVKYLRQELKRFFSL